MFLDRSEMRGYEVTQFLSLAQIISNAKPVEESEKKSSFKVEEN